MYGVYVLVSIVTYQLFLDIFGIGLMRTILASAVAASVLILFVTKLRMATALFVVAIVQFVLPVSITIFSLFFFVGASTAEIKSVLPEILSYGALAWFVGAIVLLGAKQLGEKLQSQSKEPSSN